MILKILLMIDIKYSSKIVNINSNYYTCASKCFPVSEAIFLHNKVAPRRNYCNKHVQYGISTYFPHRTRFCVCLFLTSVKSSPTTICLGYNSLYKVNLRLKVQILFRILSVFFTRFLLCAPAIPEKAN